MRAVVRRASGEDDRELKRFARLLCLFRTLSNVRIGLQTTEMFSSFETTGTCRADRERFERFERFEGERERERERDPPAALSAASVCWRESVGFVIPWRLSRFAALRRVV